MIVSFGSKNAKKTDILVDGSFVGALYPGEIRRLGLEDEGEITEELYHEMMQDVLLHRAKLRVMNILIRADKTEAELRKKLSENGYCNETVDKAIEYVRGFHYIDDLRTAESYIRSRMYTHSEREIRYNLEQKGIASEHIDMAYDQALEAEEVSEPEYIAAKSFLTKKLGSRLNREEELSYEELQKIYAAAYRKGFRQEIIKKTINSIINGE
ncbi:MAG: recombination regulator RecX [Lachnospiraceae bacterium]|nr:recombination regulator RecX [Lachnospiraceae bacterium]